MNEFDFYVWPYCKSRSAHVFPCKIEALSCNQLTQTTALEQKSRDKGFFQLISLEYDGLRGPWKWNVWELTCFCILLQMNAFDPVDHGGSVGPWVQLRRQKLMRSIDFLLPRYPDLQPTTKHVAGSLKITSSCHEIMRVMSRLKEMY